MRNADDKVTEQHRAWLRAVKITDEELQNQNDKQLAVLHLQSVIIHHKVIIAKDNLAILIAPEDAKSFFERTEAEIKRRGKTWQIGFYGDVWLDDPS